MQAACFATLLSLPLFEGVDAAAVTMLNLRPSIRVIDSGRTLFDRHDRSFDVYFLVSGDMNCVLWTGAGKEFVFSSVKPGSYFGELSAIDGKPRLLAVYARSPSEVVILSRRDFLRLLEAVPSITSRVLRNLVALVRRLTDRLHQSSACSVDERVRAYLANLASESRHTGESGFFRVPSHAEIANAVGANREAVTRAMSHLNKSGILESGRRRVRFLLPTELLRGIEDVWS